MRTSNKNTIFKVLFSFTERTLRTSLAVNLIFLSMVSKTKGTLRTLLENTILKGFVFFLEGTLRTSKEEEPGFSFSGLPNVEDIEDIEYIKRKEVGFSFSGPQNMGDIEDITLNCKF